MTPERWQQICDAVDQAMEMTVADHQDFLNRLREEDTEVASEVEATLRQQSGANQDRLRVGPKHLLEENREEHTPNSRSEPETISERTEKPFQLELEVTPLSDRAGNRIGPCHLQEKFGAGGFGEVWLALREGGIANTHLAV